MADRAIDYRLPRFARGDRGAPCSASLSVAHVASLLLQSLDVPLAGRTPPPFGKCRAQVEAHFISADRFTHYAARIIRCPPLIIAPSTLRPAWRWKWMSEQ